MGGIMRVLKQILAVTITMCLAGLAFGQETPSGGDVVATFNGGQVTVDDMNSAAFKELLKARQQLYQAQTDAARSAAYQALLEQQAAKEGLTADQLEKREVDKRVKAPEEKQIDQLIKRYRSRLPKDDDKARATVVEALQRQARGKATNDFMTETLRRAGFRLLLSPPRVPIAIAKNDPFEGPADAPVTIVEFSDFQCPYCAKAAQALKEVRARYGKLVRVVHKPFPIASHSRARQAAEAALCAADQGQFEAFHDWIFENRNKLSDEDLTQQAKALGLDMEAFTNCYTSKAHDEYIQKSVNEGRFLGVTATPTFFINGRLFEGAQPVERFDEMVDEELRRLGIQPPQLPEKPAAAPVAKAPPSAPRPAPGNTKGPQD